VAGLRWLLGAARIREANAETFSSPEPTPSYRRRMDIPNTLPPAERPDPTQLQPALGHLLLHDSRSPEEQQAASLKESARRKGRGRSKWWEAVK
jgi:hypothetical protein